MEKENEKRERKLRHYPSSMSAVIDGRFVGKCKRSTYYSMIGAEPSNPIDAYALFKMQMGNDIHDTINDTMNRVLAEEYGDRFEVIGKSEDGSEEAFIWEHPELGFPISGRMDKLIKIDGKVITCEWKSTYAAGVKDVRENGAKIDHLLQIYLYLTQDVIKVDAAILMYVARDSGLLFGFYIEKEGDFLLLYHMGSEKVTKIKLTWNMILPTLQAVEFSVKNKKLPDRDYTAYVNEKLNKLMGKSDWQCRYCSYRGLCYGCEG